MLKDEIKKKSIKKGHKKPSSTWLTCKTRDPDHEIVITPQK
jgi:hypothetical protein